MLSSILLALKLFMLILKYNKDILSWKQSEVFFFLETNKDKMYSRTF